MEFDFTGTKRFAIKRRIGGGGMGVVYEAFDRELETRVALKTLKYADAKHLYRLKVEFRSLQGIEHPNLIRLGELVCDGDTWFFTMEFIEGVDFLTHVRMPTLPDRAVTAVTSLDDSPHLSQMVTGAFSEVSLRPLPPQVPTTKINVEVGYDEPRLRDALRQLAQALQLLHSLGKVHRDIKPSNVLVTTEGRVVLLDFGLVRDAESDALSTVTEAVGTAAYMPPEQAISGDVGPAADWYSFGVVLYEALTGHLPYYGKTAVDVLMKKQQYTPAPPRASVREVPSDLDALCVDLLRILPTERPSGNSVLERLGLDTVRRPSTPHMSHSSRFSQSVPFVGRERELKTLKSAYLESRQRCVTVLVRGESGIGKSELVRQFAAGLLTTDPSVVVLSSRCYEREFVPYKAFDGIADELTRFLLKQPRMETAALLPVQAGALPDLFPVLRRVEAIASAPRGREKSLDPQEQRKRLFSAMRELFVRLSQRRPVVVIIDDFQWADSDSLTLLDELLHPPDEPALLLICTLRSGGGEAGERTVAPMERLGGDLRTIDLDALPPAAAAELVTRLSPRLAEFDLAERFVQTIAHEAAGHPLFIFELVLYAREEGNLAGATKLDDALWSRISKLPPEARQLVEVLAVAGAPLGQDVAANAVSLDHQDYQKATSLLRVAHLVRTTGARGSDTIETYHDRVREAVVSNLDENRRRQLHFRLAISLERAGAAASQPQILLRHLERAGERDRAARLAEDAAERATRVSAFDRAADLYRTALRLGAMNTKARRRLQMLLGEALINAGRGPEAAESYLAAAVGAEPAIRMTCQQKAAEQWLNSGYIDRGLDALNGLLAEVGQRLAKTPRRALISLLWHRTKIFFRGLGWRERLETQVSQEDLTTLDVYKAVAHGLGMVDNVRGADYNARFLMLALKTGEISRVGRAIGTEAVFVSVQGPRGVKRGRRLVSKLEALAQRADDPYLKWWKHIADAGVAYAEGRFRYVAQTLEEAEEQYRDRVVGGNWELNSTRLFRVFSARHMGAWRTMRRMYEEYTRDATRRGDRFLETTLKRYCSFLWLLRDEPEQARQILADASWMPPEGRFHLQHWFDLESKCEICLYDDEASQAIANYAKDFQDLNRSLLLRIQIVRAISTKLRGILLVSAAKHASDPSRLLSQAARLAKRLERERVGYAGVFAQQIWAGYHNLRGDSKLARQSLERTIALCIENDMEHCAMGARYRLGQLHGGGEGQRLIEQASRWLEREGVTRPERICDVIFPGFSPPPH